MKKQKGITLIALVITIIVLLILAGVSIATISGDDGIAQKAADAKEKTNAANADEEQKLKDATSYIDEKVNGGNTSGGNTLAAQITEENYGDYVNYNKDLGLTLALEGEDAAPTTDWRIFYKEGDRVYLIAADYVPNTSSLLNASSAGMRASGDYSLYWSSAPSALSNVERQDSLFGIISNSYVLNASNSNSKCVSNLLDTEHWKNFVDGTVADYAIGGPTIEMYTNSWNGKGYGTITPTSDSSWTGYKVNDAYYVNMSSDVGYSDNLYYTHKTYDGIGSEGCVGYWLASPSADDVYYVMGVNYFGNVCYNNCSSSYVGVRPVVSLKSGISATQDANGVWQLGE